jgi:CubicO group peptidase (beta-lactamase class C family)
MDGLLTGLHEQEDFSGAVVVARDGVVLYERGFGFADVDVGVPFTPDTPTNIASVAKTLTAAAIMMLVADGRVEMDAPVTTYLAEFPYPRVTVRHLLAHTSGLLPGGSYFSGVDPENVTAANPLLLSILATIEPPLSFPPGTAFQYSNAAFDLAALLVERVSDESFASFLGRRVFEPLEMRTAFVLPALNRDWEGVRTRSYRSGDDGLEPFADPDNRGQYGSHGIHASARDLYKWTASFYSTPVLSDAALESGDEVPMLGGSDRSAISLSSWRYAQDGKRRYFTGVEDGFRAFAYWDADRRRSVVFVSNTLPRGWVPQLLGKALIDIVEGRSPGPVAPPVDLGDVMVLPRRDASPDELGTLAASYRMDSGDQVTIGLRDGIEGRPAVWPLFLRVNDGHAYNAFPARPDLYVVGLDASVLLVDDERGRTLYWMSVFQGTSVGTLEPSPVPGRSMD